MLRICNRTYSHDPHTYFLYLNGKWRYSIILSSNENIRPCHTQLSRKSVKRIRERKLEKAKEQNKTAKNILRK